MIGAFPSLRAGELRLRGCRVQVCGGDLSKSFRNAKQSWTARSGVVIELWDEDGVVGIGEASPLPGHSRSTLSDCQAALTDLTQRMSGWDAEGWPVVPSLAGLPEARFAFETALCDLLARRHGVSVATFLGGHSLAQIPRNAVISTIEEAHAAVQRGITTLKIKVGSMVPLDQESQKEADKELLFLKQLRDELGQAVTLRLDANGVYDSARARKRLAEFARYDVALFEQPTASAELASLGVCAIPWAVDESLSEPMLDAASDPCDRFLSAPGCRAWVVKPALHGLRSARRLALRAIAHGLDVIVTHLIDGPVALAAACELALSLPVSPLACGLDVHAGLAAWPPVDIPQHRQAQHLITPSGGIGLGFARQGVPWS